MTKARNPAEPRLRLIAEATAEVLAVPLGRIVRQGRRAHVAEARQVAHLIARRITTRSAEDIGHYIGGVDHVTVLHGVGAAGRRIEADEALQAAFTRILALVEERHAAEMAARPGEAISVTVPQAMAAGGAA